jgi:hypothetical protein
MTFAREGMNLLIPRRLGVSVFTALFLVGGVRAAEEVSAVLSIDGSGRHSIDGSGRHSIDGSGRHSIDGSGRHSIDGSGRHSIDGSGRYSVDGADASPDVVLFGSLNGVGAGVINVLGQEFDISELGLDEQSLALQVGRLVYVEATPSEKTLKATVVKTFQDFAVPGATTVFVQGPVTSVDSSTGRVSVGDLQIDVNSVGGISAEIGALITVTGTQPVPQGLILGAARL